MLVVVGQILQLLPAVLRKEQRLSVLHRGQPPACSAATICPSTQGASVPVVSICTPSPPSLGPSGPLGSQPLRLMAANVSWALAEHAAPRCLRASAREPLPESASQHF